MGYPQDSQNISNFMLFNSLIRLPKPCMVEESTPPLHLFRHFPLPFIDKRYLRRRVERLRIRKESFNIKEVRLRGGETYHIGRPGLLLFISDSRHNLHLQRIRNIVHLLALGRRLDVGGELFSSIDHDGDVRLGWALLIGFWFEYGSRGKGLG